VIEIAKSANINVIEKHILPTELEDAQEIFLTGTAAEISPVGSILEKQYKTSKITLMLIKQYQKLVRS
jgi:branched-chain amino acid aminotransferase